MKKSDSQKKFDEMYIKEPQPDGQDGIVHNDDPENAMIENYVDN